MDGADVRVLDDAGRVLGPGEVGEIVAGSVSGDNEFTYHGDDAKRHAADRDGLFAPATSAISTRTGSCTSAIARST